MSDDELVERVAEAMRQRIRDGNKGQAFTGLARAALAVVDLPAVRAEAERAGFQRGFEAGRE